MTLDYGVDVKTPWSQRINFRMVFVIALVALLIGYPVYILIQAQLNGGIKDVGGGFKQVDLKAMSSFEFDQVNGTLDDIPQKWRDLNGKKVVTYGEMWAPTGAGSTVDSFQLCYSIAKCCFNGPPLVQHFVDSHAEKGKDISYYSGQVKVEGVLHVYVTRDAGRVSKIYHMDVSSIEPAT